MADFDAVKGIRGPKLSDLAEHVNDVLAVKLGVGEEYEVGTLELDRFDFVARVLSGLSAAMQSPAQGTRPRTTITVPINDDKGGSDTASQTITLYGPGDVLGVDGAQIVRRYPAPGSTNAEETYQAHIEFDRPELPWVFSAQTPSDQMSAWLTLVVLETTEIEWEPAQAGLLPVIAVAADRLPPLANAWAFAHAQVSGAPASLETRLSTAYAPINISRLVASRVLTQETNYTACLVPTAKAGVNAGLNLPPGSLDPAWSAGDGTVRLPVYDSWEFRTAPDGDFARLARRLVGIPAPWRIGRRIMQASRPGTPLSDLDPAAEGSRQVIRCALYSPNPALPGSPNDSAAWPAAEVAQLKDALERPAIIEGQSPHNPGAIPDLPIVGPRIYAKAHRASSTLPAAGDWFADLNLTPTNRVVAGLGTRVVIKDQEPLMQAAWAQVSEIDKVNRALALAELARKLAERLHARLDGIDPGRLLMFTRPLAPRVRLDGNQLTLAGLVSRSATPPAALDSAFRRAVRDTGPLMRRFGTEQASAVAGIAAQAGAARDFSRVYVDLEGISALSETAIRSLDLDLAAREFGIAPDEAVNQVRAGTETLSREPSLATAVTQPESWGVADAAFLPGEFVAERVAEAIRINMPEDAAADPVRARSLGGLAAGLAASNIGNAVRWKRIALDLESTVTRTLAEQHQQGQVDGPVVVPGGPGRGVMIDRVGGPVIPGEINAGPGRIAPGRLAAPGGGGAVLRANVARVPLGVERATAARRLSVDARGEIFAPIRRVVFNPDMQARGALTEAQRLDEFRSPSGTALAAVVAKAGRIEMADVRTALSGVLAASGVNDLAVTPARSPLAVTKSDLLVRLDPNRTVLDVTKGRVKVGALAFDPFLDGLIRPIMAAPLFKRPMYKALYEYDPEWLVPGLGTLPEPELVTLLAVNDVFMESFLVGLSDEMGCELLWRNYPTDSRGTYFRRFWNPAKDELTVDIHRFARTPLGRHVASGPPGQSGRAVVVIRGEVVRRYPDLTVMALRQEQDANGNFVLRDGYPVLPEEPDGGTTAAKSLFTAMLPPDIMLAGLDITIDELRAPGWWIVIGEHPQAPRFERQDADLIGHEVRFVKPKHSDASWHGGEEASARLAQPTRIAFEAIDFLKDAG